MCAKNTDTANRETRGFCLYKCTNGIKRHLLVDVLGNVYFVHCTPANISDNQGLLAIIKKHKEYFLNLPQRLTILLDHGYHKDYLAREMAKIDPLLKERVSFALAPKITPEQKSAAQEEHPDKKGFVVQPKRWIVERTNAWINQCRVLWKNCEGLLSTSEAKIKLCLIRLILRRLA
jgi:transposase